MSSITSKYAVPFVNRRSYVSDNVVTRALIYSENESLSEIKNRGIGYLKIILPTLPLDQNCIGFKIIVYNTKDNVPKFEGHISGNSSDGFHWLYASSNQARGQGYISNKTTLFCAQVVDPNASSEGKKSNILKSIIIGDEKTEWGTDVTVSIEYLSGTLRTTPDTETNEIRTSSVKELTSISEYSKKSNVSDIMNYSEGWRFEIGPLSVNQNQIITTVPGVESREGQSMISLSGAIQGTGIDDGSGTLTINTSYTGNQINLRDESGNYGYIIADGSQLVNLDKNVALTGFIPESAKSFVSEVDLTNTANSDVLLRYRFSGPGTYSSTIKVNKFNVGEWNTSNIKEFSVRTTTDSTMLTRSLLNVGDIGLLDSGENTDLFVGSTGEMRLVGGMKICMTDEELEAQMHYKGKTVFHNGVIKVSDGSKWVPMVLDSSGVIISMDSIDDGEFYQKVKATSILENEVNRLIVSYDYDSPDSSGNVYVTSTELRTHLDDQSKHVSAEDRARWNSYSESTGNTYTKSEVNDLLDEKSNINHYHYHHDPVSLIRTSDNDDFYPKGTRVLFTGMSKIKTSLGDESEGIEDPDGKWNEDLTENFLDGSIVVNLSDYTQYINEGGTIRPVTDDIVTKDSLSETLLNYITGDKSYVLKTDNWSLSRTGRNLLVSNITDSTSGLTIGSGFNTLSIETSDRPTYNGKRIMVDGDVDESKFAKAVHYHRNHEPIKAIVASLPTSDVKEADRYILHETIQERRNNRWEIDESTEGDIVFNIEENKFYKFNGTNWVGISTVSTSSDLTTDSSGNLVHSNNIDPTSSVNPKIYAIKLDSHGHVNEYRDILATDLPDIPANKIIGGDYSLDWSSLPYIYKSSSEYRPGVFDLGKGIDLEMSGDTYTHNLTLDYVPSTQSSTVYPSTFFKSDGMKYYTTSLTGVGLTDNNSADVLIFSKNEGGSLTNALVISKGSNDIYLAQGNLGSSNWNHVTKVGTNVTIGNSDPSEIQINSMKDGDFYIFEGAYEV